MQNTSSQLKSSALKLSKTERAKLAHWLILSLEEENDDTKSEIDTAWETEIEKRIEQVRAGTAKGEPSEKVFAKIRSRYK